MKIYLENQKINITDIKEGLKYCTVYIEVTRLDKRKIKMKLFNREDVNSPFTFHEKVYNLNDLEKNNIYTFICIKNSKFLYLSKPILILDAIKIKTNFRSFGTIYIPDSDEDECIMMFRDYPVILYNIEDIFQANYDIHDIIQTQYPGYKYNSNLLSLIAANSFYMNPNDSLSYIESQLDFVTTFLIKIIESNPSIKQQILSELDEIKYNDFKNAFEENSLFSIKSQDKCIAEICNIKKRVRNTQVEYYNERSKILKGD